MREWELRKSDGNRNEKRKIKSCCETNAIFSGFSFVPSLKRTSHSFIHEKVFHLSRPFKKSERHRRELGVLLKVGYSLHWYTNSVRKCVPQKSFFPR